MLNIGTQKSTKKKYTHTRQYIYCVLYKFKHLWNEILFSLLLCFRFVWRNFSSDFFFVFRFQFMCVCIYLGFAFIQRIWYNARTEPRNAIHWKLHWWRWCTTNYCFCSMFGSPLHFYCIFPFFFHFILMQLRFSLVVGITLRSKFRWVFSMQLLFFFNSF